VVENGRGTGALRKLGALPERRIADGLVLGTQKFDQYLWTLNRDAYHSRPALRTHMTLTVH
jgi:hypothetical protein